MRSPDKGKAWRIVAAIALGLSVAAAAFTAGWFGRYYSIDGRMRTLMWMTDTAKNNFYRELDEDALYGKLYDALVESLEDPYAAFYTADEYERLVRERDGSNDDTGIVLTEADGLPYVSRVVGNSPAWNAGLRQGMYILGFGASESALVRGSEQELRTFISGSGGEFYLKFNLSTAEEGARVARFTSSEYLASYCFYRDSEEGFSFTGEKELSLEADGNALRGAGARTAYIRIDRFTGNVAWEFAQCLALMRERGRRDLILDLRADGGGYLGAMVSIASHLMRNASASRPTVATVRYRDGREERYVASRGDYASYFGEDSRFSILADERTASASECLIGAMIDYGTLDYGNIFLREEKGTAKTYGKGIMQTQYEDGAGSMFKLTVAEVHWPVSDRCIHGVGVTAADGATPVTAPLVWTDGEDAMLAAAVARLA